MTHSYLTLLNFLPTVKNFKQQKTNKSFSRWASRFTISLTHSFLLSNLSENRQS
jgi:hypothetical protein